MISFLVALHCVNHVSYSMNWIPDQNISPIHHYESYLLRRCLKKRLLSCSFSTGSLWKNKPLVLGQRATRDKHGCCSNVVWHKKLLPCTESILWAWCRHIISFTDYIIMVKLSFGILMFNIISFHYYIV